MGVIKKIRLVLEETRHIIHENNTLSELFFFLKEMCNVNNIMMAYFIFVNRKTLFSPKVKLSRLDCVKFFNVHLRIAINNKDDANLLIIGPRSRIYLCFSAHFRHPFNITRQFASISSLFMCFHLDKHKLRTIAM